MLTNVYVDGFNLYYGALKGTAYKWLDIAAAVRAVVDPKHEIGIIKYFTARLEDRPHDPTQSTRQDAYLRALVARGVLVVEGQFQLNRKWLPRVDSAHTPPERVQVFQSEEKGSDVNLATELLWDAFNQRFSAAIVVSNDSDLCLPISKLVRHRRLNVGVVSPYKKVGVALRRSAKFAKSLHEADLGRCQLPDPIIDSSGRAIRRPASW
ncbi:MAG: NYN domain-containing protein [Myxococcota bacterium]